MIKRTGLVITMLFFLFGIALAENIEATKAEIYSVLRCCACNEPFTKCVCPEAREMKTYITALLETRVAKDEIYYKVAKKYSLNVFIDNEVKSKIEKRLSDEIGLKRPKISLNPSSYSFGELYKSQGVVKKSFTIYNEGNSKLVISNIKTSCGCVSASLKVGKTQSPIFQVSGADAGWQAVIDAGKSASVKVALDLGHGSVVIGRLFRQVYVFSNDPLYPQAVITLEGNVKK